MARALRTASGAILEVLLVLFTFASSASADFGQVTVVTSGNQFPIGAFGTALPAPLSTAVAVDNRGSIYIAYDIQQGASPVFINGYSHVIVSDQIFLARSTDGGATFSVNPLTAAGPNRDPAIAVGTNGEVYVTYVSGGLPCDNPNNTSCFNPTSPFPTVQLLTSTNGAETFSAPQQISTPGSTYVDEDASGVAVDGLGRVYILWSESGTDPNAPDRNVPYLVQLGVSIDRGQSFKPPITLGVASLTPTPCVHNPDQFCHNDLKYAHVAVTQAGLVHATWLDCSDQSCFVLKYRRVDLDNGTFSSVGSLAFNLSGGLHGQYAIALDPEGQLSVAYAVQPAYPSLSFGDIWYQTVVNGVTTNVSAIALSGPSLQAQDPAVVVTNLGIIEVAWVGHPPGATENAQPDTLFFRRSYDGGRTFSSAVQIGAFTNPYSPTLTSDSTGTPLLVYFDSPSRLNFALHFASGLPTVRLLDPNPDLLEQNGNLVKDLDRADSLTALRKGSAADGISKLVLLVNSSDSLAISIDGRSPSDLTDGSLSPLTADAAPTASLLATSRTASNGDALVGVVYTPPDLFPAGSTNEDQVTLDIRLAFDPTAEPLRTTLLLEHPPVVLVHGLWSNPAVWINGGFVDSLAGHGFSVLEADYSLANAASFDPTLDNKPGILSVKVSILDGLNNYRARGFAAAQADVVGHSMGGLMARGLIQQADYLKPTNYNKGLVHRLITIGTPHHGSGIAQILFEHRNDPILGAGLTLGQAMQAIGKPVDQGAVEGFINDPLSTALSNIQATPVKAHAIVASWQSGATFTHDALQALVRVVTGDILHTLEHEAFKDQDNDTIVEIPSQFAGLQPGSPATSSFPSTVHAAFPLAADTTETNSVPIQQEVASLLASTNPADFAVSLPAPSSLTSGLPDRDFFLEKMERSAWARIQEKRRRIRLSTFQIAAAGSLWSLPAMPLLGPDPSPQTATGDSPGIQITSPTAGGTFQGGNPVTITAVPTGSASLQSLVFLIQNLGVVSAPAVPPYTVTFDLPRETPLGNLNIVALARDASGALLGDMVTVKVSLPFLYPVQLRTIPNTILLTTDLPTRQLHVYGSALNGYSAGGVPQYSVVDIARAIDGTTYMTAGGNSVIQVGPDGLVTAVADGTDTIEIQNSNVTRVCNGNACQPNVVFVDVTVQLTAPVPPSPPAPTASLSPQPNAAGWNKNDVTVTLAAADNAGGSGVKQITYSASGAQAAASATVHGSLASVVISTEGITTLTFFATDNAGNVESAHSVTIKLDKTPPSIAGSQSPAPNASGWNNSNVTVHFACSDTLSGLVPGSPPADTILSAEGAGQSVQGTCQDVAGNSASATVLNINIDKTPPVVSCSARPNSLWPPDHKLVPVNVSVVVTDSLSGPAGSALSSATSNEPDSGLGDGDTPNDIQGFVPGAVSTSGQLRAERSGTGTGRTYTLSYQGKDRAGNAAACATTITVPHDQGKP
jgi:pimeloyl-ACP methyl ester carboxylesterase